MTLYMGGVRWVFLNKKAVVDDLLDKRSAIYSSRPDFPMTGDIISGGNRIVLMKYTDRWRSLRKVRTRFLQYNCNLLTPGNASTPHGRPSRHIPPLPGPGIQETNLRPPALARKVLPPQPSLLQLGHHVRGLWPQNHDRRRRRRGPLQDHRSLHRESNPREMDRGWVSPVGQVAQMAAMVETLWRAVL